MGIILCSTRTVSPAQRKKQNKTCEVPGAMLYSEVQTKNQTQFFPMKFNPVFQGKY